MQAAMFGIQLESILIAGFLVLIALTSVPDRFKTIGKGLAGVVTFLLIMAGLSFF